MACSVWHAMLAALADGPLVLARADQTGPSTHADGTPAQILSVAFATSTVRSDRVVAARLQCTGAVGGRVTVEAVTPGFSVDLLPQRSQDGSRILVAVRIHRRLGTVRRLCLVRFRIGESAAVASISVLS